VGVTTSFGTWSADIARRFFGQVSADLRNVAPHLGPAVQQMAADIAAKIREGLASIAALIGSFKMPAPQPFTGGRGGVTPEAPGTPGTGDFMVPQRNYVPPPRAPSLIPIRNEIKVDGHTLGMAAAYYIARDQMHVQSGAQYDGMMSPVPVDIQMG
jgi:hypothetical protein